ncbi:MAG: prohibitin family protein [Desulfobacteraceae bacterium]|nr:prohibitin family protein [Desulfobacteraceae bacterium]
MFKHIVIIIGPGEAGVLYRLFLGGTLTTEVYPEGIRFIWPFDKMYIYNVRIQETATELDVLTKTGLEVHLYLSIRYAPEYKLVGVLHKNVGPDYVNRVIIPEIESVLREVIGTMKSEEIYTTGREVITMAIEEAIEQVAQRYINVDDVIIKRIELPPEVADTIRFKIKQKHLVEAHEFIVEREKKEADRKRIEGQGVRDQNKIITESLSDQRILTWHGIQAVRAFAKTENSTVVIVGGGEKGLPIIGSLPLKSFAEILPSEPFKNKEDTFKQAPRAEETTDTAAQGSDEPAVTDNEQRP